MKSQSDPENLEKLVNSQLDAANNLLPKNVNEDICQARVRAITQAKFDSQVSSVFFNKLSKMLERKLVVAGAPLILAVLILVNYKQSDTMPMLPAGVFSTELPSEDLAMLEDLEFASWLAEQQEVFH
jgi:hypothetical protein